MRQKTFLRTLLAGLTIVMLAVFVSSPTLAGKKSVKKSSKKSSAGKKKGSSPTVYYVTPPEENIRVAPNGQRIGGLVRGTPVTVTKTKGNWAYVTVKAWIWKPSLSKTKPKQTSELLVQDVEGVFKKNKFVIKGMLVNQTKIAFGKVVIQGELFRGKKRVAHKSLTLFSVKKPRAAGKTVPFSITFKRTKGFDSYSVRILSASEK